MAATSAERAVYMGSSRSQPTSSGSLEWFYRPVGLPLSFDEDQSGGRQPAESGSDSFFCRSLRQQCQTGMTCGFTRHAGAAPLLQAIYERGLQPRGPLNRMRELYRRLRPAR